MHAADTILSLLPRIIADALGNLIARHRCKNQSERHDSEQRADRFCKGVAAYEQENEKHQGQARSEEHTSELQSLMRSSYAVFCLKKKKHETQHNENR